MGTKAFDSKQDETSLKAKDISRPENNESLEAGNLLVRDLLDQKTWRTQ